MGVEGTPSYSGSVAGERPRARRDARAECAARGLECSASMEASMHATLCSRNKRLSAPSHQVGGVMPRLARLWGPGPSVVLVSSLSAAHALEPRSPPLQACAAL